MLNTTPGARCGLERHPLAPRVEDAPRSAWTIHGFDGCPVCVELDAWFQTHAIPFERVDHPDHAERQRWYDANEQRRDEWGVAGGLASRTMPQVFLDGLCLGISAKAVMGYKPEFLRSLARASVS